MNYCSQCGKPVSLSIPEGDNRERHVCDHCQTIHYQNPRVIAGCLPLYENKVLLCKRAISPREGFWTLPAGFLENGESMLEGALRECHEEALAELSDPVLSSIYDVPHIHQVHVFYRGELASLNFAPGIESLEVELFEEHQVPWKELAFPVVERVLHYHFEDTKQGIQQMRTGTIEKPWRWLRS